MEIFGGAGGLALGVTQAGFDHLALVDVDPWACETIKENQRRGHALAKKWPLYAVDVRKFDYGSIAGAVDLLTAGLPCQPFSFGGKGKAHKDKRDMFSEVVRAARELRPKAILMENVKGLVRSAFKEYFEYLLLAIASPGLARAPHETWRSHFDSLQRDTSGDDLKYDVHVHTINAADYGVPQWRDRVLIVAFRSDLAIKWSLPPATHGVDALLWAQLRSGTYWRSNGLDRRRPGLMSRRMASRVQAVKVLAKKPDSVEAWRTVRDAICDLPELRQGQREDKVLNHFINRGARSYSGHNGSLIDEPAKTIKAGIHGVPGGENSLYLGGGRIRYFSVRECARLQTFPDDYFIAGSWSRAMRQVGNAVPVLLAKTVAAHIRSRLESGRGRRSADVGAHVIPFHGAHRTRRAG